MSSEYLRMIEALRKRYKTVLYERDWLGLPIVVLKAGGREEPPVLVTAGASAVEAAGVYAALELVMQVDVERAVYILPSRDPTGLHGAVYVLSEMLGEEVHVDTLSELRELLKSRGAEVVIDTPTLFLSMLKGVGFAFSGSSREGAYGTLRQLEEKVVKGGLIESLGEVRILIPSQMPNVEGVGLLDRLMTVMVCEEGILTYEHIGGEKVIPEVEVLRRFIQGREMGMVIDLHEGVDRGFYVLLSEEPLSGESIIIDLVLDQVARYGMQLATQSALGESGLRALSDGVGVGKGRCGLIDFTVERSYSFAFFTGMNAPLEQRVKAHLTACISALNAYAIARL
ncbi:MAG: hypothetical protein DRK00_01545 [Thermoprotei archaeon]|nr:MAG: hypothetical protein DRK00_01545 [Thermoprotei archaeon]